jgi:hypothetical protein
MYNKNYTKKKKKKKGCYGHREFRVKSAVSDFLDSSDN